MRQRAKHSLSHYRMHTANMGELFPIGCVPVLPGDTLQHQTTALIRVTPLNTPVMHPVRVRIHHFFVPNRVVFPDWEDFITGGEDGLDSTTLPTVAHNNQKKSVLSYLGCPPINSQTVMSIALRLQRDRQRVLSRSAIGYCSNTDRSVSTENRMGEGLLHKGATVYSARSTGDTPDR